MQLTVTQSINSILRPRDFALNDQGEIRKERLEVRGFGGRGRISAMQRATRGRNGNASRKADHEQSGVRNDWAGIALEIEREKALTRRGRSMEGRWEVQKWFLSDPIVIIAYRNYHLSRSMLGNVQLHPMVAWMKLIMTALVCVHLLAVPW